MRKQAKMLLPLMLLCAPVLWAQETLVPLAHVVRRVIERDPGVRAHQAEREAAKSEARRTETLRLPKLYVSTDAGAGKLVNDVANVLLTGLSPASVNDPQTRARLAELSADRPFVVPGARLETNLFDGGRTGAAIRTAWLSESKAEVAGGRAQEEEAYAAAADFLRLAEGRVLGRYLEENVRVAELAAAAFAEQARAGRTTEAKALLGQAQLQAARARLENNRDDVRLLSGLLRERAGLSAEAAFDTRPLEVLLEDSRLSLLPDELDFERNAELQIASLDTRIQEQQLRSAKTRRLPELKFVAEYGFAFSSLLFTFRPGYNVGVRASYPLFTSREVERSVRAEQQRLSAATLREEKTRAVLREESTRLLAENRKIARQLDAARAQLTQAGELYRITRLKYDQGAGAPADLLEAAELLFNSRQRCLELTRSSLLIRWDALRLQGKLLAELQGGAQP
jgi:outer membrane protein TolC